MGKYRQFSEALVQMAARPVAVVTGGSKGIGLLTARHLASKGWDVGICARNHSEISEAVSTLSLIPDVRVFGETADVARFEDMARFAGQVRVELGETSLIICNAAVIGPIGDISSIDTVEFMSAIGVNLGGVVNTLKAFWSHFQVTSNPRAIVLGGGGLGGPKPMKRAPSYVPSKAAVVNLVEGLAEEFAELAGTINAVSPGNIPTGFMDRVVASGPDVAGNRLHEEALARDGQTVSNELDDFLVLLDFLARPDSNWINGRFLSAKWNSPHALGLLEQDLGHNLFRLRRIDDDLFKE